MGYGRGVASAPDTAPDGSSDWLGIRLAASWRRLAKPDYAPQHALDVGVTSGWPADYPGRLIVGLTALARSYGQQPPALEQLIDGLPGVLNEKGYLGPVHPEADEQQLAGHSWLVSGLLSYHQLTGSDQALQLAMKIVHALLLPGTRRLDTYPAIQRPTRSAGPPTGRISDESRGWRISSDTYCVLIVLEGLVAAFELGRDPTIGAAVQHLASLASTADLVASQAQLHASLTAARCLLSYHQLTGDRATFNLARKIYRSYRRHACTANDAPYNWFGCPGTWTEPCATVDALLLALRLWQRTRDQRYLDDAHSTLFNGLGYALKPGGGFGCDTCTGPQQPVLESYILEAWWCCSMRGPVGLSAVHDFAYDVDGDTIHVPFYRTGRARLQLPSGSLSLSQQTDYPTGGTVSIRVDHSDLRAPVQLRFYSPLWTRTLGTALFLNDLRLDTGAPGRAEAKVELRTGDHLKLTLPVEPRLEPYQPEDEDQDAQRAFRGPLLLGQELPAQQPDLNGQSAAGGASLRPVDINQLVPICTVSNITPEAALHDRRRIIFTKGSVSNGSVTS